MRSRGMTSSDSSGVTSSHATTAMHSNVLCLQISVLVHLKCAGCVVVYFWPLLLHRIDKRNITSGQKVKFNSRNCNCPYEVLTFLMINYLNTVFKVIDYENSFICTTLQDK